MKVIGIIAEYNPFHKGHEYQIQYAKENLGADYVITAMSGDYVQRGTPALLPKHLRAKMALLSGADLVLELPVAVSCASAEFFAAGGVSLLSGLGVTDELCFGSEEGDMTLFHKISDILEKEPAAYREELQRKLRSGLPFPAARSQAVKTYLTQNEDTIDVSKLDTFLSSPNNILGLEYCKALLRQNSTIKPVTLKRTGAGYHDTELVSAIAPSASGIRNYLNQIAEQSQAHIEQLAQTLTGQVPDSTLNILSSSVLKNAYLTEQDFDLLLHYCLLSETQESLCKYLDVSPELASRIIKYRNQYQGYTQFTELLKTKELTYTRIQRALLHIILKIKRTSVQTTYARVLGFRKEAGPLLKEIKQKGQMPLITKLADAEKQLAEPALHQLQETAYASNIYESLLCKKSSQIFTHEYEKQIIIL